MRKMISSNIINKLAVQDGRIGTYVEGYSIKCYMRPARPYPGGNIVLASGITELGSEWVEFQGPAAAGEGEIVYATTYFGADPEEAFVGFNGYVANINGLNYWLGESISTSVVGTFNGENVVIHTENIIDEVIGKSKTFKAFALE